VSAAKSLGGLDAAFVLDGQHNVWECARVDSVFYPPKVIATNVLEISASTVTPDTVFAISAVDHSVSEYQSTGYFNAVANFPLGSPSSGGPFQATDISAGKEGATGKEAVFVNFNGVVYEHTGLTANAGWSSVAGVNFSAPHNSLFTLLAISDFSASQAQGDTVFVVDLFGSLSEERGQSGGPGTPLSYTDYSVAFGVFGVSAGVDANGQVAAFALDSSHSLDEYTFQITIVNGVPGYSFSKAHVADSVTGVSASQITPSLVFYTTATGFHSHE
jgi:hypothetical protein